VPVPDASWVPPLSAALGLEGSPVPEQQRGACSSFLGGKPAWQGSAGEEIRWGGSWGAALPSPTHGRGAGEPGLRWRMRGMQRAHREGRPHRLNGETCLIPLKGKTHPSLLLKTRLGFQEPALWVGPGR